MSFEYITDGKRRIALVVRGDHAPGSTSFLTEDGDSLQLGFICRNAGEPILRHYHVRAERQVADTWEFLLVRQGSMTVTLYDDERQVIAARRLVAGDSILLMAGAHGFEVHEDLVLLEVKMGPYLEHSDKVRF
jgi:mannose-6-phosphate isomerase-like protein (cupin superfamily)